MKCFSLPGRQRIIPAKSGGNLRIAYASGEIAGEQIDGRWRLRKSVLDAWLDAEVSPEELEKLTTKMSRLSEEQARQVLEQAQAES